MTVLDSIVKSRDITLLTKVCIRPLTNVKVMVFPLIRYGCGSWTRKMAEELMLLNCDTGELLSLLYSTMITPVNPKGNQPCIFIGRADVEAEAPVLWPPDVKR